MGETVNQNVNRRTDYRPTAAHAEAQLVSHSHLPLLRRRRPTFFSPADGRLHRNWQDIIRKGRDRERQDWDLGGREGGREGERENEATGVRNFTTLSSRLLLGVGISI